MAATPVIELSRIEQRMMRAIERRGLSDFVMFVTLVSVLLSQAITIPTMLLVRSGPVEMMIGVVTAFVVPSIVAPMSAILVGRLLQRLAGASSELQQLARTDSLTGVANRRAFAEETVQLWDRRADRVAVVAMIDIDDFKAVNDRYGHATGDLALTSLAANLTSAVGVHTGAAVVGRLGGDEFAVVALVDDHAIAASLGAALVAACDLHATCSGVTATAGWLMVPDTDDSDDAGGATHATVDEALARADHALYAAKRPSSRHLAATAVPAVPVPGAETVSPPAG